jgi:cutinase
MGSTVCPAVAKALISAQGSGGVAVQGVNYAATIESNISGGSEGGPEMAQLAKQALSKCPDTKVALGGYSQGGMVMHYAVRTGGLSPSNGVIAAVGYGDPQQRTATGDVPLKEFCGMPSSLTLSLRNSCILTRRTASGDGVCETGGFAITAAHLYASHSPRNDRH